MTPEDRETPPDNPAQPQPQPSFGTAPALQSSNPKPEASSNKPFGPGNLPFQPETPHKFAQKFNKPALWWSGLALGLVVLAAVVLLVVFPIFNRSGSSEADPFAVSSNSAAAQAVPVSGTVVATTPSTTDSTTSGKPLAPGNPSGLPASVNGAAAQIVGRGEFTKIDSIHYARGTATVGIGTNGKKVLRFENFTSAQGPDLKVYLGVRPDGSLLQGDGLNLGALPATDGSYNIPLPDDLDLTKYKSVVVWCEAFSVPFSVASLG